MPENQEIITRDAPPPPEAAALPTQSVGGVLSMIDRVARDPSINVEKMERILQMQLNLLKIQAARDAAEAKARVLMRMPRITRRGEIVIQEKGSQRVLQRTPYAKYEDIEDAIRPILAEEGFTLTHRCEPSGDGRLLVTGVLTHRGPAGIHEEIATLPLPPDPSGSKNAAQAMGSAMSYGRRYTTTALLNIITEGEDDDGRGGGAPGQQATISAAQKEELLDMLAQVQLSVERFCKVEKIARLEDLAADRFAICMADLADRGRSLGLMK